MDSILTSIKKMLGIAEDYEHFDPDIIMHINTVFLTLQQMGVGPDTPYSISDSSSMWDDFFDDKPILESVKTYMYLKVRTMFDPPQSSIVMEALNRNMAEIEWRLTIAAEQQT